MVHHQASYILETSKEALQSLEIDAEIKPVIDGLFENKSTFDVMAPTAATVEFINPVLAVRNNIITRGKPTLPSILVEQHIADCSSLSAPRRQYGSIRFPAADVTALALIKAAILVLKK